MEDAETAEGDLLAARDGALQLVEGSFDDVGDVALAVTQLSADVVNEFLLVH